MASSPISDMAAPANLGSQIRPSSLWETEFPQLETTEFIVAWGMYWMDQALAQQSTWITVAAAATQLPSPESRCSTETVGRSSHGRAQCKHTPCTRVTCWQPSASCLSAPSHNPAGIPSAFGDRLSTSIGCGGVEEECQMC